MKAVFKNIICSVLPQIVNIITNLILPGLIIAKFGSEINGLISTTKTVVSYISLVGAGIASSVTQALYKPVANKDYDTVKGMLKASDNMFNRYGCLYILITLLISLVYPCIIHSEINNFTIICLLIVMSISGASEFFIIGRCRALLYAHQKVYVCSIIQALSLVFSLVLAIVMILIDVGIVWVQLSVSVTYIIRGVFLSAYVNKTYPYYTDYKRANPVEAAVKKRKDAMIHQLSGLAVTGSQAVILTTLIDLKAASIYSVYNIVLSGIKMICSNLCTSITPFIGKKYALEQKQQLKQLYNVVEFLFFLLVTFIMSVTSVMLVPFITLYTKGADINYIYPIFSILFVVSSTFYILKLPGNGLINVAGHFKETKWRAILEATVSVVLSVIFTIFLGKEGVLIGTGCALGWRCIDTIMYTNKYILQTNSSRSLVRLGGSLINILLFSAIFQQCFLNPDSYIEWVKMAFFVSFIVIAVLVIEIGIFERKTVRYITDYIIRKK